MQRGTGPFSHSVTLKHHDMHPRVVHFGVSFSCSFICKSAHIMKPLEGKIKVNIDSFELGTWSSRARDGGRKEWCRHVALWAAVWWPCGAIPFLIPPSMVQPLCRLSRSEMLNLTLFPSKLCVCEIAFPYTKDYMNKPAKTIICCVFGNSPGHGKELNNPEYCICTSTWPSWEG